ncbi:MAG: substrate-binding domain-containing protein [Fimbriimonadales bacterium]
MRKQAAAAILASILAVGCSGGTDSNSTAKPLGERDLIVFSQANSQDPWRQVFDAEMKSAAAAAGDKIQFEMAEAHDDPQTQISQVEAFLLKNPKALLISPASESLTAICAKAFDKGIPVIVLDRGVEGEKYTTRIAGDNLKIGNSAAEYIGQKLGGKGTVLIIQGIQSTTATEDRQNGALDVFKAKYPGIKLIGNEHCDYQRVKAHDWMANYLQTNPQFDAVYAHNDEMAIGAAMAMKEKGITGKIVVGVDACQMEVIEKIKSGDLTATFLYPHPAKRAIEVAMEILAGKKDIEKMITLETMTIDASNADQFLKDHPNLAK